MKRRVKSGSVEFDFSGGTRCKKHPYSYSVGVCPVCLKERLLKLVEEERRISSYSCPDVSASYRSSCSAIDADRVSLLIQNEKKFRGSDRREEEANQSARHRKSLWRLFRKRSEKKEICDVKSVSRSRSLCSFRGDDGKLSDATDGIFFSSEHERRGEDVLDETDFFDLKFDLSADLKQETSTSSDHGLGVRDVGFLKGGSFGVSVKERETKRKSKVWRWMFKNHPA